MLTSYVFWFVSLNASNHICFRFFFLKTSICLTFFLSFRLSFFCVDQSAVPSKSWTVATLEVIVFDLLFLFFVFCFLIFFFQLPRTGKSSFWYKAITCAPDRLRVQRESLMLLCKLTRITASKPAQQCKFSQEFKLQVQTGSYPSKQIIFGTFLTVI